MFDSSHTLSRASRAHLVADWIFLVIRAIPKRLSCQLVSPASSAIERTRQFQRTNFVPFILTGASSVSLLWMTTEEPPNGSRVQADLIVFPVLAVRQILSNLHVPVISVLKKEPALRRSLRRLGFRTSPRRALLLC